MPLRRPMIEPSRSNAAEGRAAQVIVETAPEMGHPTRSSSVPRGHRPVIPSPPARGIRFGTTSPTHAQMRRPRGPLDTPRGVTSSNALIAHRRLRRIRPPVDTARPSAWLGSVPGSAEMSTCPCRPISDRSWSAGDHPWSVGVAFCRPSACMTVTTRERRPIMPCGRRSLAAPRASRRLSVCEWPRPAGLLHRRGGHRQGASSWDADLIAVGTRGNGLVKRLLVGSTQVLAASPRRPSSSSTATRRRS